MRAPLAEPELGESEHEQHRAEQVQNFGLASAASVLLGAVLLVLTLTQLWLGQRRAHR